MDHDNQIDNSHLKKSNIRFIETLLENGKQRILKGLPEGFEEGFVKGYNELQEELLATEAK
jgi:hypothetical protein